MGCLSFSNSTIYNTNLRSSVVASDFDYISIGTLFALALIGIVNDDHSVVNDYNSAVNEVMVTRSQLEAINLLAFINSTANIKISLNYSR